MCVGNVKSVDYPTVDDILSNEVLKSSDKGEAEKVSDNVVTLPPKKRFFGK